MTPYDFVMDEVALAILRVTDALMANDPLAIVEECAAARRVCGDILQLYPKLQLQAEERDALLWQISVLGSQLDHCERFLKPPVAVEV